MTKYRTQFPIKGKNEYDMERGSTIIGKRD